MARVSFGTPQADLKHGQFNTTRWSVIHDGANVANDERSRRAALGQLCRIYWRPVFLFIMRRGFSPEDAQDLTQDFFAMMLETNWLRHADQNRGRFRSLLRRSLQHFLIDEHARRGARKRGGGAKFVSWDDWMSEAPSQLAISEAKLEALPPEHLFDVRWAASVVEQAMLRLRQECEAKSRRRLFEALRPHLISADHAEGATARLAHALGVTEPVVKMQLHNLRQRYRWLLRDEVSRTVSDPADIDDEIRHLCAVLAART